jgi:hypothetical protein
MLQVHECRLPQKPNRKMFLEGMYSAQVDRLAIRSRTNLGSGALTAPVRLRCRAALSSLKLPTRTGFKCT